MYYVVKRDGTTVPFNETKITQAVYKAAISYLQNGKDDEATQIATKVTKSVTEHLMGKTDESFNIEDIQDCVERKLMEEGYTDIAKAYILYRQQRTHAREAKSLSIKIISDLLSLDAQDMNDKRENANIDGNSVCGTMLQIAGSQTRNYALNYVRKPYHADMHRRGVIHENDIDFNLLTLNCVSHDTEIVIRDHTGQVIPTTCGLYFSVLDPGVHRLAQQGIHVEILDHDDVYTKIKMVSIRQEEDHINMIRTTAGSVKLTDNHIVPIARDGQYLEVLVSELQAQDTMYDQHLRTCTILDITQEPYSDLVFDFETESHYFSANGLRVHNCLEIPMDKLWEKGFATGHGYLRPPATIGSAATQICIAIQSNQNDMFKHS